MARCPIHGDVWCTCKRPKPLSERVKIASEQMEKVLENYKCEDCARLRERVAEKDKLITQLREMLRSDEDEWRSRCKHLASVAESNLFDYRKAKRELDSVLVKAVRYNKIEQVISEMTDTEAALSKVTLIVCGEDGIDLDEGGGDAD